MIKTWREAYEVPNSAEEAKRMMRSQSQALTYRSMIKKLPASGIRIEVDDKKM